MSARSSRSRSSSDPRLSSWSSCRPRLELELGGLGGRLVAEELLEFLFLGLYFDSVVVVVKK